MGLESETPRVRECVRSKQEQRRRAGSQSKPEEVLIEQCKREVERADAHAAWVEDWTQNCIDITRMTFRRFPADLKDVDSSWNELENFAYSILKAKADYVSGETHKADCSPYVGLEIDGATWLTLRDIARAITHAKRTPLALLRELGLTPPGRGKAPEVSYTRRSVLGNLLLDLEEYLRPSDAMRRVQDMLAEEMGDTAYSESALRSWRDGQRAWREERRDSVETLLENLRDLNPKDGPCSIDNSHNAKQKQIKESNGKKAT